MLLNQERAQVCQKQGEEDDQRVAAPVGRVVDEPGSQSHQRCGGQGLFHVEHPAGGEIGSRDGQGAGQESRDADDPGLVTKQHISNTHKEGVENVVVGRAVIGEDVL